MQISSQRIKATISICSYANFASAFASQARPREKAKISAYQFCQPKIDADVEESNSHIM
jgi:hypothetical protein